MIMTRRVLIVDDEDDIREVARVSLSMVGGFDVLTASSGSEALKMARDELPDAILLDVMMPDMDGPTVFQKLRSDAAVQSIPVILLTAKVQANDHRQFVELGVTGVIAKPFDPMRLSQQVVDILCWN